MLVLLIAALLVMVAAIALLEVVGHLWALVPVMLIDFAATIAVMAGINRLLADADGPPA